MCWSVRLLGFRTERYLGRNHAILVGLLVRIFKFMRCIAILGGIAAIARGRLCIKPLHHTEIIDQRVLSHAKRMPTRCSMTSCQKASGLKKKCSKKSMPRSPQRGGDPIPMEKRMLESINRAV